MNKINENNGSIDEMLQENTDGGSRYALDIIFNLTKMRIDKGLSQNQLAKLSGVSHSTISRIESGNLQPTIDIVSKLLYAMDSKLAVVAANDTILQTAAVTKKTANAERRKQFVGNKAAAIVNPKADKMGEYGRTVAVPDRFIVGVLASPKSGKIKGVLPMTMYSPIEVVGHSMPEKEKKTIKIKVLSQKK